MEDRHDDNPDGQRNGPGHDGEQPPRLSAEDDAISAKVKAAIVSDPSLSAQQINVDTKNAVVTLNGNVDDSMSKTRAMQVAQTVNGVRTVVDNLEVKQEKSG